MKVFIPLASLLMLAACGGTNKESSVAPLSPEQVIQKVEAAFSTLEVGQAAAGGALGDQWILNQDEHSQIRAEKLHFDVRGWKVILKVEGDKIFTYEKSIQEDGTLSDSVNIYSKGQELNELREMLLMPGSTTSKGRIKFQVSNPDIEVDSLPGATIMGTTVFSGSISITNPLCDLDLSYGYQNLVFTLNNVSTPLEATSFNSGTRCELASIAQVKAIDLSSITVCDSTSEEENCTDEQDMRHLTADL